MALNIKNHEVEKLIYEVSEITGESKTETVRRALEERKARLVFRIKTDYKGARLKRFLESEAWPIIPKKLIGKRLSRKEEEAILGFGPKGI